MVKCPKCQKEITHLDWSAPGYVRGTYDQEFGLLVHEADVDEKDQKYFCPECHEQLLKDEKEANEFLKD